MMRSSLAKLALGFVTVVGCGGEGEAGGGSTSDGPAEDDTGSLDGSGVTDGATSGSDGSEGSGVSDGDSDDSTGPSDSDGDSGDPTGPTPGVDGEIVEGSTIVIHALDGEDFGDQGPPVDQVFDRFVGKQAGDPRDPSTPELGQWLSYGYPFAAAPHEDYEDAYALSSGVSFQGFTQGTEGASLRANGLEAAAGTDVREVFMSANMLVPPGGWGDPSDPYVDAQGWPSASLAKIFWMMDGPSGGSVPGAWDMLAFGINDASFYTPGSGNEPALNSRGPEEFPSWPGGIAVEIQSFWEYERWHLLQYGFAEPAETYGSTPAAFRRLLQQDGFTVYADLDTSGQYEPFAPGVSETFDRVTFPGFLQTLPLSTPAAQHRRIYVDDVYIALGPGAMCRVELHDTEADADATIVALSPVVAGDWSADAITVTLRLNDLVPADPTGWWLKVFGPEGQRLTARQVGG